MWKVGGTEIERTRARNIFFCQDTEIREKAFFPAHHNFLKDRTDRTEWEWTLVLNVKISQDLELSIWLQKQMIDERDAKHIDN